MRSDGSVGSKGAESWFGTRVTDVNRSSAVLAQNTVGVFAT